MKRTLRILFAALCMFSYAQAQSVVVTVADRSGNPIAGAEIRSEKHFAITDEKGNFDATLFADDSLVTVSHVAFETETFSLKKLLASRVIRLKKKTYRTGEVKIDGEKKLDETVVNIDVRARTKFAQTSDLLGSKFPLFVKDYGGYAGLKTVSFRGMSSENTLVLFNEARVNDLRSGAFDFASVGINSIDAVSFSENESEGYVSSGGIVNLISGVPLQKNGFQLGYSRSNLNSQNFYGKGGLKFGALSANFNFERSFSPNEFPFKFENELMRRANADYQKTFYGGSLIYNSEKLYAKIYSHYSRLENGLPGFVVTNNVASSQARTESENALATLNVIASATERLVYKMTASVVAQNVCIADPARELLVNRDYEKAELNGWNFNNSITYNNGALSVAFGGNLAFDKLNSLSPAFLGDVPYSASRFTRNYFVSPRYSLGDFAFAKGIVLGGTFSYLISNEKILDKKENAFYPSALAYVEFSALNENLRFGFSYAESYRTPTFTELYYSQVFSPDKIEAENYGNFSVTAFYEKNSVTVKAAYFHIDGKNKIIWTPTRLALQIPRNVKAIKSDGAEISFNYVPEKKGFSFGVIYVYTNAKNVSAQSADDMSYNKFLIYSPRHQLKANANYEFGNFFVSLDYSLVSERYYTADNNPRYVLPAYNVFDFSAGTRFRLFGIKNSLTFNIYNLTNEEYFIIQSYPMPLRTVSFNYFLEIL